MRFARDRLAVRHGRVDIGADGLELGVVGINLARLQALEGLEIGVAEHLDHACIAAADDAVSHQRDARQRVVEHGLAQPRLGLALALQRVHAQQRADHGGDEFEQLGLRRIGQAGHDAGQRKTADHLGAIAHRPRPAGAQAPLLGHGAQVIPAIIRGNVLNECGRVVQHRIAAGTGVRPGREPVEGAQQFRRAAGQRQRVQLAVRPQPQDAGDASRRRLFGHVAQQRRQFGGRAPGRQPPQDFAGQFEQSEGSVLVGHDAGDGGGWGIGVARSQSAETLRCCAAPRA